MNYLDLFSGIGGFHLGLKWSGFEFNEVYYSDIDDYANKIYAKNFPEAIPLGDITKICPYILPKIDMVTAGFPCQDISVAGKQKGIKGERSGLFYEIIRLCSVLRPEIVWLENVPNLITGGNGLWFKSILGAIAEIGYDAEWQVISAANVGARHRRDRVWIVAYPERFSEKREKPENGEGRRSLLGGKGKGKDVSNTKKQRMEGDGGKGNPVLNQNGRKKLSVRGCERIGKNKQWTVEPELGRVAHGIPRRVDRLKCLGNAVVPQVVQLIGEMILKSGILINSN